VIVPSILTLFVPAAARSSLGLTLFLRCLIGLLESPCYPAVYHFFPVWIPLKEKTLMIPAVSCGMYLGEIFGFSLSGVFIDTTLTMNGQSWGGWQLVFYVFGLCGVLWFPLWCFLAFETPDVHPYISEEEKNYLKEGKGYTSLLEDEDQKYQNLLGQVTTSQPDLDSNYRSPSGEGPVNPMLRQSFSSVISTDDRQQQTPGAFAIETEDDKANLLTEEEREDLAQRIPWKNFFTHPVSLTLFVNNWVYGFIGFTLLSEMPSFFTDILGFDLTTSGVLCVFPYLALFIASLGFGYIFEYFQLKQGWSVDRVRQVSQWVAYVGSGAGLILCGFMDNKYAAYTFVILTQAVFGAAQVGLMCAYSDVAPNFSSALNSVGNTIGALAGIVGPLIVAEFTTRWEGWWGWRITFFLVALQCGIALIFWSIYQTSKPVPELNLPLGRTTRASKEISI
jgi:MFS family permease